MNTEYWYLASPYSKYAEGLEAAFVEASKIAARLIVNGTKVYCPIAHTHPIAVLGGLDALDHTLWMPVDEPFMEHAVGLLIAEDMEGWEDSYGIQQEILTFTRANKPIKYVRDGVVYDKRKEG